MDFDLGVIVEHRSALLEGLWITLVSVALAGVFGTLLGLAGALGKMFGQDLLRWMAFAYVDGVRALPELIVIFWIYACFPLLFGLRLDPFAAGVLALSLFSGAYLAEIFRAGFLAVPKGQWEAAKALGLGLKPLWLKVIFPQAFGVMLPALISFTASLIKATSLLVVINVGVLAWQATIVGGQTYRYFEMFTAIGAIYFVLILPLSLAAGKAERKLNERRG